MIHVDFSGEVWWWRGPSPFHFVTLPREAAIEVAAVASAVSYGWGVIPVEATVGSTTFTTSLFPKDGGYVLPLKAHVRAAEAIELGDVINVTLRTGVRA